MSFPLYRNTNKRLLVIKQISFFKRIFVGQNSAIRREFGHCGDRVSGTRLGRVRAKGVSLAVGAAPEIPSKNVF